MSLYKHVIAKKSGRLVEWFSDVNGNHKLVYHLEDLGKKAKNLEFLFSWIGDANRKYNRLAMDEIGSLE